MNDYILKIWTRRNDGEPESPRFSGYELTVVPPREVKPEEIPAEVLLSVPGVRFVTELHLTPDPPTDLVRGHLMKFALRLAKEQDGAVENLQPLPAAGEKRLTSAVPGFAFPAVNGYTEMLTLSVWFPPDRGFDTLADAVYAVFERYFPPALPVQYGSTVDAELDFEANGGKAFFLDFLRREPAPVWIGHAPVTHVYVADAARRSSAVPGFRAGCLTVELPDKIYDFPEWGFALRRLLRELARVTGAFFGQIARRESGVVSWWWRGIPLELGVACVIGEPYFGRIPDCGAKGRVTETPDGGRQAYFEEPEGPFVPAKLLSARKKRLFRRRSAPRTFEDFTLADELPVTEEK